MAKYRSPGYPKMLPSRSGVNSGHTATRNRWLVVENGLHKPLPPAANIFGSFLFADTCGDNSVPCAAFPPISGGGAGSDEAVDKAKAEAAQAASGQPSGGPGPGQSSGGPDPGQSSTDYAQHRSADASAAAGQAAALLAQQAARDAANQNRGFPSPSGADWSGYSAQRSADASAAAAQAAPALAQQAARDAANNAARDAANQPRPVNPLRSIGNLLAAPYQRVAVRPGGSGPIEDLKLPSFDWFPTPALGAFVKDFESAGTMRPDLKINAQGDIGWGHKVQAWEQAKYANGILNRAAADTILAVDLQLAGLPYIQKVIKVSLNSHQVDALLDITYNAGSLTKELIAAVNSGNDSAVETAMKAIMHSGGVVQGGLVERRAGDWMMWSTGGYPKYKGK